MNLLGFKMKKQQIFSFSILILFIAQIIVIPGIQFSGILNGDQLINGDHKGIEESMNGLLPESSASGDEWWNETFMYRIPLTITEPGIMNRINETISVSLTFETDAHRVDSTRLVSNESGVWHLNPFQLNNVVYQSGNLYIKSFTIYFFVTVMKSETAYFWVYYSEEVVSPYIQYTQFQNSATENLIRIDNGYYQLELTKGKAYTNFQFKGDSTNLHTNSSLMPTRVASSKTSTTYKPDSLGFIRDWLLIGPFKENPSWASHESGPTIKRYQLDIKRDWALGENASGGTSLPAYSNPNKQWFEYHSTTYNYIDLNSIFGGPDDCVAYAMCYVYTNVTLNNIYLKVGSDDSIAVVMDNDPNAPTWENYVQRGLTIDNDVYGPFNMSAGWHSFKVYANDRGGGWSFIFRFATTSAKGNGNEIKNLVISLVPPTKISTLTTLESGPIYSKYQVTWSDTADMKSWDIVTVYSGNTNAWKCERTFWWGNIRSSPTNSSFGILNTLFKSPSSPASTAFDNYLYPPNSIALLTSGNIMSNNYTIIRDNDSPTKALGIYISDVTTGPGISLTSLNWATNYTSTNKIVNMLPGNQTNLNKPYSFSSYDATNAKYNVTVTFWEYLNRTTDFTLLNNTYLAFKSPLTAIKGVVQHIFFDLDMHFIDHDGFDIKGVTITLINATDGTGWDFEKPVPVIDNTNDEGDVHFSRLKGANYTVNVTYVAYGHSPLLLETFNITLDESKSLPTIALGLTTLAINLQKYDAPMPESPQPIVNANVSFYEGNDIINPSDYVGSIFSDAFGFVSFVWLNQSSIITNYSFKVEFLGNRQNINVTIGIKEFITLPLENFTSLDVTVHVGDFSTFLNIETGSTMESNFYRDIFLVNVSYWYNLGGTDNEIGAATVTYTLRRSTIVIDQGTFTPSGPAGYYYNNFNTAALGMLAGQSYTLSIAAERSGYTRADNTTFISLLYLPMDLTPDESVIEINWLENITFGIYLNDTHYDNPISDATVTYEIAQIPSIHGNLIRDIFREEGWYNLTLNSTEFPNYGSYTLSVRATRTNYADITEPISIAIRQIRTLINGTIFLPKQFEIFVGTVQVFHFNYTDSDGKGISNAELPSWELQSLNDEGQVMWGTSGNLIETAQIGIYQIDGLDTSLLKVGRYSIVVRISVTNYVERQSALSLTIKQITIQMRPDITLDIYESPKGTEINISISIFDPNNPGVIENVEVNITYRGKSFTLTQVGTSSMYYHLINTNNYDVLAAADTFTAVITIVVNENYTFNPIPVTVSIQPPLGPLGIPLIYWIIGSIVGGVAIGAFVTARGIHYARIPMMVKDLQATLKVIKKNGKFSNTKIERSPDELIEHDSETEYESVGLSLKGKLSPQKQLPDRKLDDINQIERRSE
jgi:hypothetical protein